jgi:hypothetical protein
MGMFLTNLHVRAGATDTVVGALAGVLTSPAYVSEPSNGWVSVYPEETESQDTDLLEAIATNLSLRAAAPVLAILLHDSDVFNYWLADNGVVVDRYDSWPAYFDPDLDSDAPGGGNAELLARYGWSSATAPDFESVLRPADRAVFAEDSVQAFAKLAGIPEHRALAGNGTCADGNWSAADGALKLLTPTR